MMGGSYEIDTKLVIRPVMLSEKMLQIMEESCKAKGHSYKRMPSAPDMTRWKSARCFSR